MAQEQFNIENLNPLDSRNALNKLKSEIGWKVYMREVTKIGNEILSKILDLETEKDKRELYVHEMDLIGRLTGIVEGIEEDAKAFMEDQKGPKTKMPKDKETDINE